MKRYLFILSCMLAIASYGQNKEQKTQDELSQLIKTIYAEIASEKGSGDDHACKTFLQLIDDVNKVDENLQEIGFFNEHIWTQMQDSEPDDIEARDIKFEQIDVEKGTALASFVLDVGTIQTVRFKFAFCREDGDWRVHDIITFIDNNAEEPWFSYREGMKNYLEEMKQE